MNELALFAGAGGGLLASQILKWRTVCAVENDPYCQKTLLARQRDNCLPRFPIWDDVRTFDGKPWKGTVDIISGGFPCQNISYAGDKTGITGKHSSLYFEMLRIIKEVRPTFVFIENSANLRSNGLHVVIKSLAELGYNCRWCVLGGCHVNAPHYRKRIWIVGYTNVKRPQKSQSIAENTEQKTQAIERGTVQRYSWKNHKESKLLQETYNLIEATQPAKTPLRNTPKKPWWHFPYNTRVDDGLAHWMDRIRATGNGQIPAVAIMAWKLLTCDLDIPSPLVNTVSPVVPIGS